MGHEVSFVDYWPGYHRRMYAQLNWRQIMSVWHLQDWFRYIKERILSWNAIKKRIMAVTSFIDKYVSPKCTLLDEKYDLIVCGSDQIWRKQPEHYGYNPVYFGKNSIRATKQISYAASMGNLPSSEGDKTKVKEFVSCLDAVSVRENNLAEFLRSIGIDNVEVSLDPTLLLSAEKWNTLIPVENSYSEKYALFYEITEKCFDENQMRDFCNKHGWRLIILRTKVPMHIKEYELYSVGPDKFVNLVRSAEFVFTSSFHGLAFSIINHKNFLCSNSLNSGRLKSLLHNLCIDGHYIEPMNDIPSEIPQINYNMVDEKMITLRAMSLQYLTSIN